MKRFTIGYFLFIFLFLLSGFHQLFAHSFQKNLDSPTAQVPENSNNGRLKAAQKSLSFTAQSIASDRTEFETDLEEEDETEREQLCLKKILVSSNLFTAVFYAQPSNCAFQTFKAVKSNYSGFLSIASVKQYLKFQIFRI